MVRRFGPNSPITPAGGGGRSPAPYSSFSVQLPSSPSLSVLLPRPGSPSDENRIQLAAPDCARKDYETVAHNELHRLRRHRGCAKKDSEAVLQPRLSAMDVLDRRRARDTQDELPGAAATRKRVDENPLAIALAKEVAKARPQ